MKKYFLDLLYEIRLNRPFTSVLFMFFFVVVIFAHFIVAEDTTTLLNSTSGTSTYSTTSYSPYNTTSTSDTSSTTTSSDGSSGTSSGGSGSSSDSTSDTSNTDTSNTSTTDTSSSQENSGTSDTTPTMTTTQTEDVSSDSDTEQAPTSPLGLTATPGPCGSGKIYIFWYSSSDAAGYLLYRNNTQVYKGSSPSFLDSGLTADTSYSYKLYLFNTFGLSSAISLSVKSPKACETTTTEISQTTISTTNAAISTTTTSSGTGNLETKIDEEGNKTESTKTETISSTKGGGENEGDSPDAENTSGTSSETSGNLSAMLESSEDIELLYKDSNEDGISDYDSVHTYNIDPVKPSLTSDYEGRSINASEKVLLGFDPTTPELVKIIPEEPEFSGAPVLDIYKVEEVGLTEDNKVLIKGTALPNSFVTIYIYSTPIIVTVKTNNEGQWQYTLDEELENGQHKIYTATVNNTGKIVARSSDSIFTKTAEAATLGDIPPIGASAEGDEPGLFGGNNFYVLTGSISAIFLGFFILIGLMSKKKIDQTPTNPAP